MKKAGYNFLFAIGVVISFPFIILFLIGVAFYTPFDYYKYRRSRYFKDTNERYGIFLRSCTPFKIYNAIKEENLSIEYLRHKKSEHLTREFFYCGDTLITYGWAPEYDEDNKKWYVFATKEKEDDEVLTVESIFEEEIAEFNEAMGFDVCKKAVALVEKSAFKENHYEIAKENEMFLIYERGKLKEALRSFSKKM